MTVAALVRKKKTTAVTAVPATAATAAATAIDAGQQLKKNSSSNNNRARRRGARGRSRSKLEIAVDVASASATSATTDHGRDEEDEEVDDAYEREDDGGHETEDRDHVNDPPHESLQMAAPDAARDETAVATAAMSGAQPEASFVRRNAGGRRRQQLEKVEELIPLSFLTNALFTPPPQPTPAAPGTHKWPLVCVYARARVCVFVRARVCAVVRVRALVYHRV
jgi:hypothetical protein